MNQFKIRMIFIVVMFAAGCAVVVCRLFTIQVLDSERYVERSRDQTQMRKILTARRGSLVDRFGRTLAASLQSAPVIQPDALGLKEPPRTKGVAEKRIYPLGEVAGPLLGYVGTDGYGLGGVELAFDNYLRGEDGWIILQKDGRNQHYRKIGLPEKTPCDGCDVTLTVDSNIQKIVQVVLGKAVRVLDAKGGMCIVLDPRTGAVLAMANEPSFNPNMPSRYSLSERQNRCISAVYEPGSTFKIVTASIAVEENIKAEDDLIYGDNGSYRIFDQVIRDHKPYGYLTFKKAFTYSSNICFAKVANEIGNERFYRYVLDYGFGSKTAIDLPGEECGIVHPVKRWSGRTRVTMAMGQEVSVTLLQMLLPFAAVANGGVLVTPRILGKITDPDGAVIDSGLYKPVRRVLSEPVAERLRWMLKDVVDNGTGKRAAISQVDVAGKTGTSQKPDSGGYSQTRSWSSFIGFVPVETPKLLCGVVIDEPARGEMGGAAAAPVFRKIITQILSHPELEFAEEILDGTALPPPGGVQVTSIKRNGIGAESSRKAHSDGFPDCIGKDLRDAVNMVNGSGYIPYAIGYGTVENQKPLPGVKAVPAAVCTLYCSVRG